MIRFEIKDEVVEWLEQEYIGEPDATELIEGLMGLMIAHDCISVTPAPDAALVEALRPFAACAEMWLDDDPDWILHRSRSHWPGKPNLHITVGDLQRAAAALASVEQGGE